MGFFDLFKKKNIESKNQLVPAVGINQLMPMKRNMLATDFQVHDDIKRLIWIGNGKKKNYIQNTESLKRFEIGGVSCFLSFSRDVEPSLIFTNLEIACIDNRDKVERPSYYPTYSGLTSEQRAMYLNLLRNPYDNTIDVGYVFILYYGLERHLLTGNFEDAFNVILKLRDVHSNGSFQYYSGNALVLSCLYYQRPDLVEKLIESLDNEYELKFSDNLFLICAHSFDIPLYAKDIIRMAKTFEFENKNYIKKHPELFENTMQGIINNKYGESFILLKNLISDNELKKMKTEEMRLFANVSLSDNQIKVPKIADSFKLKKSMFEILEATHETVKQKLPELRKKGVVESQPTKKAVPKILVFDYVIEKDLLDHLKSVKSEPIQRHFAYIAMQEFYYKYRTLDDVYIDKCVEYCLADINSLNEMQKAYEREETRRLNELSNIYSKKEISSQLEEIRASGFCGNIPAFKRLAIVYEKKGEFLKAIEISNQAIQYGQRWGHDVGDFVNRIEKMQSKLSKQ